MDIISTEFLTALATIIFIDLVLAGDNAIVIGMAARKLPQQQQKKAIIWGTVGAITIRIIATVLLVKLLEIPWLHLIGGLLLIWIAFKLVAKEKNHDDIKAANTLGQSIRTIIIADAAMGIDNVLAVAGAAAGNILLVITGLLISIPIIVWGSTLFIRLVERFEWIIYIGAAVLAFTAAKMIANEQFFSSFFAIRGYYWTFVIILTLAVVAVGYIANSRKQAASSLT